MIATSRSLQLVGALALLGASASASADVITFGPGPIGAPVASTVEGLFRYDTFSGGLFRDTQGNGDGFNMEGFSGGGGGVLRIVRDDIAGASFTFDAADVAFQFGQAFNIRFEGFLSGVSQGFDDLLTNALSSYTTQGSTNLSGVLIDELRVTLNATPSTATVVDNVVLTPGGAAVPEPATAALLAGMVGFLAARRRR